MNVDAGRPQMQSLGAWLAALSPGDPCPWCGAGLEAGGRAGRSMRRSATPTEAKAAGGALVCRECGCEVGAVDEAGEAERRILHQAA